MNKFYGEVGYGTSVEDPIDSGIWVDYISEISYFGDVQKDFSRQEPGSSLNSDLSVNNRISIIADKYAIDHFSLIKYVRWAGVYWTVTSVEVQSPRLILSLGKVYNGPKA